MLKHGIAANSFEIAQTDGDVPEWVQLVPAGEVLGRDGRKWLNSDPGAVIEYFRTLDRDLPVDIEHATEHKAPKGEPAPAMAWGKELEVRDGQIWGRVEWNAAGRQLVGEKEYRYLSPVILYNPKSGVIAGLTSVALTNQPNFRLPALNSEQGDHLPKEEDSMFLKALLAALGLPAETTEAVALAKVGTLKAELATAQNSAQNPGLDKFVPRADFDAAIAKASNAEAKLIQIEKDRLDADVDTAINAALKEGKITPATVDYHKAQCRQEGGLALFKAYCAAAPVIAGDSNLDGKDPEKGKKALNAEQKKIADMFGNSAEDLAKYGR
jgi:phage I-like protein